MARASGRRVDAGFRKEADAARDPRQDTEDRRLKTRDPREASWIRYPERFSGAPRLRLGRPSATPRRRPRGREPRQGSRTFEQPATECGPASSIRMSIPGVVLRILHGGSGKVFRKHSIRTWCMAADPLASGAPPLFTPSGPTSVGLRAASDPRGNAPPEPAFHSTQRFGHAG